MGLKATGVHLAPQSKRPLAPSVLHNIIVYLINTKAFIGTGREIHTQRKTGVEKHVHTYTEKGVISLETVIKY